MKQLLLLLVGGTILLSSCSQKFSVQKRKYTKGFYFASASPKNQTKNKEIVLVKEKIVKNEVIAEPILLAAANVNQISTKTNYCTKISETKSAKKIMHQTFDYTKTIKLMPEIQIFNKIQTKKLSIKNSIQTKKRDFLDILWGANMLVNLIYTVLILAAIFIFLAEVLTTEQLIMIGAVVVGIILLVALLSKAF